MLAVRFTWLVPFDVLVVARIRSFSKVVARPMWRSGRLVWRTSLPLNVAQSMLRTTPIV